MMRVLQFVLLLLLLSHVGFAASSIKPVGYFLTWFHVDDPLNNSRACSFTYHQMNACNAPLLVEIDDGAFAPIFLMFNALPEDYDVDQEHDIWGPPLGANLRPDPSKVHVSGRSGPRSTLDTIGLRQGGIVLFRNEGYARRVRLEPGWLSDEMLRLIKHDWIIVNASPPMRVHLPAKEADAVQPGKPVRFASGLPAYAPGDRLVPFSKRTPHNASAVASGDEQPLSMHIEIPEQIHPDEDLVFVYLIGNTGDKTIYVEQNGMTPSHVAIRLHKGKRALASLDGSGESSMQFLLPSREVLALNPGEFLTWKRVIPADVAEIGSIGNHRLSLQLDTTWRSSADAEAQAISLQAEHGFRVLKAK